MKEMLISVLNSIWNFFSYYIYKLNTDLVFQQDVIKAIIAGFVAFFSAIIVFGSGRFFERRKETKRLKANRKSLYYNFKFLRLSCIKQSKNIDVIINEIKENEKQKAEYDKLNATLTTKEERYELFKKFPTKTLLTQIVLDYGVIPTHIHKFSHEDFYKILVHKYKKPSLERISSVQSFLIHTELLMFSIDSLKSIQTQLADNYNSNKSKIISSFSEINKIVSNYFHVNLIHARENNLPNVPTYKFFLDLRKKFDDIIAINQRSAINLELVMNYVNDVTNICNQNINEKGVLVELQQIVKLCMQAFMDYNEIFVAQFTQKSALESLKRNFDDISANIHQVLQLEYNKYKNDFDVVK